MLVRRALPALLAIVAASGCRALSVDGLSRREPPVAAAPALNVADIVEKHNRNAEPIVALQANPTVAISAGPRAGGGGTHGRMALELPRNFRLQLDAGISRQVADFGSNENELWLWTSQTKDKAIYVCQYDENGDVPEELNFQPDWLIEGLGLRVIPQDEVAQIALKPATDPKFAVLVHQRTNSRGATIVKQTVVGRSNGLIREHVFFAPGNPRTPIARVFPEEYRETTVRGDDGREARVQLPSRLKIESMPPGQDKVTMDIVLSDLRLNPTFSDDQRQVLFAVPHIANAAIVNVNERLGPRQGKTTVRETRPAPESGARVRLGDPVPIGADGASREDGDPVPLAADLGGAAAIVGPRTVSPPGDDALIASEARRLRSGPPAGIER